MRRRKYRLVFFVVSVVPFVDVCATKWIVVVRKTEIEKIVTVCFLFCSVCVLYLPVHNALSAGLFSAFTWIKLVFLEQILNFWDKVKKSNKDTNLLIKERKNKVTFLGKEKNVKTNYLVIILLIKFKNEMWLLDVNVDRNYIIAG